MDENYIVYVQTDLSGRITAVNSSAFVPGDWGTEIDSGVGDKYHHAQGNYFEKPVYTDDGIPRYKLQDGQPVERTMEEIAADLAAIVQPLDGMTQLRLALAELAEAEAAHDLENKLALAELAEAMAGGEI